MVHEEQGFMEFIQQVVSRYPSQNRPRGCGGTSDGGGNPKKDSETLESTSPCAEPVTSSNDPVRIMIDIRMSNGMQIRQKI